jgi:hypothetical protein
MGNGTPDVVTDLEGVHFEIKRCEALRLYAALEQAIADARHRIPVVLHRQNNKPWVAIVRLDDLPSLAALLQVAQREAWPAHRTRAEGAT